MMAGEKVRGGRVRTSAKAEYLRLQPAETRPYKRRVQARKADKMAKHRRIYGGFVKNAQESHPTLSLLRSSQ